MGAAAVQGVDEFTPDQVRFTQEKPVESKARLPARRDPDSRHFSGPKLDRHFTPTIDWNRNRCVRLKPIARELDNVEVEVAFRSIGRHDRKPGRTSDRKSPVTPANRLILIAVGHCRQNIVVGGQIVDRMQQTLFAVTQLAENLGADVEEMIEQLWCQHRVIGGLETAWWQLDVGQLDLGKEGMEISLCRFG